MTLKHSQKLKVWWQKGKRFTFKYNGCSFNLNSLRTTSQSALPGFVFLIQAANKSPKLPFSGEKQIICFISALHLLVISGGSLDMACFCSSVKVGPISVHLNLLFSSLTTANPDPEWIFQEPHLSFFWYNKLPQYWQKLGFVTVKSLIIVFTTKEQESVLEQQGGAMTEV